MIDRPVPRLPNPAELDRLEAKVLETYGDFPVQEARETVHDIVQLASIAIFDDYITDGPGYAGKLMCVVWSGAETFYEVYCWNEKQEIEHVNQDRQLFYEEEESED